MDSFPTRETCDSCDPEEAFLWMLVAPPGMRGAPLLMPVEYLRMLSKRLWECGARPAEEPTIKYRRPSGSEPHWMTSPGRWVAAGEPDEAPNPARAAVMNLTPQQRAEVLRELRTMQADDSA